MIVELRGRSGCERVHGSARNITRRRSCCAARQVVSMLDKSPGRLFVIRMELGGAGPTHNIERSAMYPSEFHLGWIAAIRAGKLDWDVEQALGHLVQHRLDSLWSQAKS